MQSAQVNWTSSVSRYLLTRRKQTNLAYQNQQIQQTDSNSSSQLLNNESLNNQSLNNQSLNNQSLNNQLHQLFANYESCLFEVILSAVGLELEQGNTVINLLADNDNKDIDKDIALDNWQRQLMKLFLSQCSSLLDMPVDAIIEQFIEPKTEQPSQQVYQQKIQHLPNFSSLDIMTQEHIKQQLSLGKHLSDFYQAFNQLSFEPHCNRLAVFFESLSNLAFFVNQQLISNSLKSHSNLHNQSLQNSNQHTPIVLKYQVLKNQVLKNPVLKNKGSKLTLWLHRNWQAEQSVLQNIDRLNEKNPKPLNLSGIIEDSTSTLNPEQVSAIETANESAFSIITGGPGTGKTYTVAQLVIAIHHANELAIINGDIPLSLVLSAPTGKAAQRMQESLQSALERAGVNMNLQEAKTIHRLLGIGQTGIPRYGSQMPLSEDVIIIDEASMLGVELADHLLSAVKTGARLILLGDAHQLSAVDAGAVLSDLCRLEMIETSHANLIESRRFTDDSAVGQLAGFINQPETKLSKIKVLKKLHTLINDCSGLAFYHITNTLPSATTIGQSNESKTQEYRIAITTNAIVYQKLIDNYQQYFEKTAMLSASLSTNQSATILTELMVIFNEFRILTTGHNGDYGDEQINKVLTQAHRQFLKLPISQLEWFHGRPVMVRKNNYNLGLFNGDIGLCVQTEKGLAVSFEGKEQPTPVNSLGNLQVTTAYAMTVHKSQGSEFTHVAIMLDERTPRLLSREMLYTAVTRAKQEVSLFASNSSIYTAITSPTVRKTGLSES